MAAAAAAVSFLRYPVTPLSLSSETSYLRRILRLAATMSIKLTTQMDYMSHANFSKNHPDNLARQPDLTLPTMPVAPKPTCSFSELDKKASPQSSWGHSLCLEKPYGKGDTRTRMKSDVTSKIGSNWGATVHAEQSKSVMMSAMYSGSLREASFEEMIANGASFVR